MRDTGYQTHGPRTPYKMGRSRSGISATHSGLLPQEHFYDVARFPHLGLCDRWNREPEFVPCNP